MVVIKEKVRARIVNVARKIFSRNGFKKSTMEDIASAAAMGKSSIYYYFKSKEDIFRAVVEREGDEIKARLNKTIEINESPIEKLKAYIRFRLHHLHTVANFYAALKEEQLLQMDFILGIRQKFDREELEAVKDILEKGNRAGAFEVTDPKLGAIAITTLMKGLELPLFLNTNRRKDLEKLLDDLIRVIFYGILKRE